MNLVQSLTLAGHLLMVKDQKQLLLMKDTFAQIALIKTIGLEEIHSKISSQSYKLEELFK